MISRRTWKTALLLIGVVTASALSGALLGHRIARRELESRNNPETWNKHVSREFDRIVKPTPEQAAKIQTRLDGAVQQLQEIRRDTIARSTNVIWKLIADVEQELTPEQRQAFETMKPKQAEVGLEVLHLPQGKQTSGKPQK